MLKEEKEIKINYMTPIEFYKEFHAIARKVYPKGAISISKEAYFEAMQLFIEKHKND